MFLIHVGFCMYEVGASRYKNHTHTLMKNTMLIPLVTITFFFFGWWIYFAFVNGPWISGPGRCSLGNTLERIDGHAHGWCASGYLTLTTPPSGRASTVCSGRHSCCSRGRLLPSFPVLSSSVFARVLSGCWQSSSVPSPGLSMLPGAGHGTAGWSKTRLSRCLRLRCNPRNCRWFCAWCTAGTGPAHRQVRADGTPRNINPHNPGW